MHSSESGDIKAYGSPKKSPAALNFALQIGMKGSKYRNFFAPAAGSPPKLLNLRQSFLTKIHTRTRQQAKMFVVPEPQTSAVESLKQRGIIRFDTAWQMPILSVGCASWSQ